MQPGGFFPFEGVVVFASVGASELYYMYVGVFVRAFKLNQVDRLIERHKELLTGRL